MNCLNPSASTFAHIANEAVGKCFVYTLIPNQQYQCFNGSWVSGGVEYTDGTNSQYEIDQIYCFFDEAFPCNQLSFVIKVFL